MTRHLDLGCGAVPRNPYARDELFGVDLSGSAEGGPDVVQIRRANLVLSPIPFDDQHFDSVSAYDFLEHVPRVLATADGLATRFPFVELMNEVWRVLRPGGLFYASTPVYPHSNAFVDPTHVNVITDGTHRYFTQPHRLAAMYGFKGDFKSLRVQLASPNEHTVYTPALAGRLQRWRHAWRVKRGRCGHVVWEFEAVKAP
jgi:SAM-dependent methyltransferase